MLNSKKLLLTGALFIGLSSYAQEDEDNTDGSKKIEAVVISKKKKKKYKNPAHEILAKLVAKKHINNPDNLKSYFSENQSRMEIAFSSLGDKFQNTKVYKDLKKVMEDSKDSLGNDVALPVFISENISDFYYQKSPEKRAEIIKKTKVDGVGIEDNAMFSQLMSSTFIKYNFYNNYIHILDKNFISPLNDNFTSNYDFELVDRDFQVNENGYYKINFKPKRASDLAFEGTLLISHSNYSLFRITAKIGSAANLNFINNIVVDQELEEVGDSEIHMPVKSLVTLETAKLGKNGMAGILKYHVSSKKIKINQDFDQKIFSKPITVLPNANDKDEQYWEKNRHEPITEREQKVYAMIDKVKNLPSVKSYIDVLEIILRGYYEAGKFDLGPILYTAGYNDVEGFRLRAGFRTNHKFSKKWIFSGYLSYGFKDREFKYGGGIDYIISRDPWTQVGISALHDLDQVALQYGNFLLKNKNAIFDAFSKNGDMLIRKPFWKNNYEIYFQRDFVNSITQRFTLRHSTFDPLFDSSYINYTDEHGNVFNNFKTTEMISETQWKMGRKALQSDKNKQVIMNNNFTPTVTFRLTHAFKGIMGSNFEYNKIYLNVQQKIPMGILGQGNYSLTAGIIPDRVPFPLLENHLGNEFVFYNRNSFNMMRFFEFTSNRFVSLQYTQYLEGLITNRLPLIKKLNWRNHLTFNYLIGDLEERFNANGALNGLNGKPYIEVGYGFSNIFRFLRVDFVHRLTHLNNTSSVFETNPPKFSIKVSAQIRL